MKQNQKGITLVGLLVTVIIILTIAGVCIHTGREILEEAKLEQLKTNMLLIQAKCQSVGEKVNANEIGEESYIGTVHTEVGGITIVGDVISVDGDKWYKLTEKDIEEKEYIELVDGAEQTKQGVGLGDIIKSDKDEGEDEIIYYYFNYKDNEVVYAEGYNGEYKLSEILENSVE